VYFCILEALQNVTKYAEASRATVRLFDEGGALAFEVRDDGRGFDSSTTYWTGLQGMWTAWPPSRGLYRSTRNPVVARRSPDGYRPKL
jgi:hypothetical protein